MVIWRGVALLWAGGSIAAASSAQKWDIRQGDHVCVMSMSYNGPGSSELSYWELTSNLQAIIVTNYLWSIQDKQPYEMTLDIDGLTWTGEAVGHLGEGGDPSLSINVSDSFRPHFATGTTLKIYGKGRAIIDRLSLAGTSAGLKSLDICLARVRSAEKLAKAERDRIGDIPADPFATITPITVPKKATAKGNPGSWFRNENDYPPEAKRNREQGTVAIMLNIDATGKVFDCAVTKSSGSKSLDETTCSIALARARYSPASDERGVQVQSFADLRVTWKLEVPEPILPPQQTKEIGK